MKQTQADDLPHVWKEVRWMMTNMQTCRESGDTKGVAKWTGKLANWRDAHPKEAHVLIGVLSSKVVKNGEN